MWKYSPPLMPRTERLKHSTSRSMNWIQRSKSSMYQSLKHSTERSASCNQQLKPRIERSKRSIARSMNWVNQLNYSMARLLNFNTLLKRKKEKMKLTTARSVELQSTIDSLNSKVNGITINNRLTQQQGQWNYNQRSTHSTAWWNYNHLLN